uniref:Neurotransmitter-gated ion-channel ligand-binding domain-containing protein n=1 Tax=Octopus bimaculoides TaxID=37653 RepID=A0A0L8FXG6_OCTBM
MLLQNYTKSERPVHNDEDIVKVDVFLEMFKIIELDIQKALLTSKVVLGLSWKDIYLLWNTTMKNITYISVNVDDIWYPTVSICNDMSGKFSQHEGEGATVKYDGSVSLHMDGIFQTHCTINMLKYPLDEHECNITVCLGHQENIEKTMQSFSFNNLHNAEADKWEYKFAVGNVTEKEIISASVTIFAKRKFMSETLTYFIFPIMLTILNLGVYLLPAESGEKVSVAITIFLANVVYLTETAKVLGTKSLGMSMYLLYLLILTLVSGFSTLISIIGCRIAVLSTAEIDKDVILTQG